MSRQERDQPKTILVVEDDDALRRGLVMNFELQGYRVLSAVDGEQGLRRAFDEEPDLIVLDIMLPHWNGLEVLEELRGRGRQVPVLVLSARGAVGQIVEGLRLGADDYMTKPFQLQELLARVDARLRRQGLDEDREGTVESGPMTLDPTARVALISEHQVDLTRKEFDLLLLLIRGRGRVYSREEIVERIWGWEYEGTRRTVDNTVLSVRKKLEGAPDVAAMLTTVWGVGYRWG